MLTLKWKYRVAVSIHFIVFMALFIRFVPWLFGSKSVAEVTNYNLSNLPAPEWALSFTINHGSAMYYKQPIPAEIPLFTFCVVLSFLLVIASGKYFEKKYKTSNN